MGINWDKRVFDIKLWVWLMLTPMLLMLIGVFWLNSKYEPKERQEQEYTEPIGGEQGERIREMMKRVEDDKTRPIEY